MKAFLHRSFYLVSAIMAASFAASAQTPPVNCTANVGAPPIARLEGKTEPVGDLTLICTGGTPTPMNVAMPQVNFSVFLNTNLTSHVTQDMPTTDFSEAVLLVDEPNTVLNPPQRPLLNCGNAGAPDSGFNGPGVCSILSSGSPAGTYDGSQNSFGIGSCDGIGPDPTANTYGCGRPNAFQGRLPTSGSNEVVFLGVPFDPPGLLGTRIFRFTNLRANASLLGTSGPLSILVTIAISGPISISITSPVQTIAFGETGLIASIGSPNVVHLAEGFAGSWKDRNVAFTLANATFGGSSYTYSGGTSYPPQAAQNVPGTIYNTEDMFQWQNNGANAPPSINPHAGFGSGPVANLGNPFSSLLAFGGVDTGINQDGVSTAGTRFALTFTHIPGHATVTVPSMVFLHPSGSPSTNSGVMILTSTDPDGAGPFTPGASTTIPDGGAAVYEVLYTNPFMIEFADVPVIMNHPGNGTRVAVSFAPFYSTASSGVATPTLANPAPVAVPRFIPASGTMLLGK